MGRASAFFVLAALVPWIVSSCATTGSGEQEGVGHDDTRKREAKKCHLRGTVYRPNGEPVSGGVVLVMGPLSPATGGPLEIDGDGHFEVYSRCPDLIRLVVGSTVGRGLVDVVVRDPVVSVDVIVIPSAQGKTMPIAYGGISPRSKEGGAVIRRAEKALRLVRDGEDPCTVRKALVAEAEQEDDPVVRRGYAAAYFAVGCEAVPDRVRARKYLKYRSDPLGWEELWPESWWNALLESGDVRLSEIIDVARGRGNPEIGAIILVAALEDRGWDPAPTDRTRVYEVLREKRFRDTLAHRMLDRSAIPEDSILQAGESLQSFALGGGTATNETLEGRVALLYAWASYCKPCVKGIAALRDMEARYGSELLIVMVNVGDTEEAVAAFVGAHGRLPGLSTRVSSSEDAEYRKLFSVAGVPSFLLVDQVGKVISISSETDMKGVAELLDDLLVQP